MRSCEGGHHAVRSYSADQHRLRRRHASLIPTTASLGLRGLRRATRIAYRVSPPSRAFRPVRDQCDC